MSWIPAAIGGAASIVGDLFGAEGQRETNAAMMSQQLQMEQWQKMMSDTAMQRRVTDLKAAGLNPMLAVGQGGASTPGISPVNLQNPNASFTQLGQQATSAMQLATLDSQVQAQKAQAEKTEAEATRTRAELPYSGPSAQATLDNLRRQNDVLYQQAENLYKDWQIKDKAQLPMLMTEAAFKERLLELQQQQQEVDLLRTRLGLPRLQNDSAWQTAHPELAGWLSSGATSAATDVVNTALKTFKPPTIFNFGK